MDDGIHSVKGLVPEATYELLDSFYHKYNRFNQLENYYSVIKYLLLIIERDKLREIMDIEDGLENRIIEKSHNSLNIEYIIDNSSSKRYPKTRIQRILIHLLCNIYRQDIKNLFSEAVPYIRFLGANKNGLELLNKIKEKSKVPILTKFSHFQNFEDDVANKFAYYERKATDIYYFGLNMNYKFNNMDYKTSPYIKK